MKKLILLIFVFCAMGTTHAQWHFYLTSINYNTNCNNLTNYLEVLVLEQIATSYAGDSYSSLEECEVVRQAATIRYSKNGCSIRTTTSPCMGGVISGGASGAADILAPSQGRSFYTTNPANEIKNWSSDDVERHLALDQNFRVPRPEAIATTDAQYDKERSAARENSTWYVDPDKPFMSVSFRDGGSNTVRLDGFSMRDKIDNAHDVTFLANQENVQRYINASALSVDFYFNSTQDLTQLLFDEFEKVSGFDLGAIMQKLPQERTEAEKQALIDYEEFRKRVTDLMIEDIENRAKEVYKELDMAILSEDCYKYSKHDYIYQTDFRKVASDFFEDGNPMKDFSNIIDLCNLTSAVTGFHADLYYNEKTNEYTIAFEGSNLELKNSIYDALSSASLKPLYDIVADWIGNNLVQGLGGIPPQYVLAALIGEKMPDNVKINITGHSLGGGLASLAGLISGKPTYTFNAEGVNRNITSVLSLNERIEQHNYDIKAIRSKDDPLTSAQEGKTGEIIVGIITALEYTSPPLEVMKTIDPELSQKLHDKYIVAPAIGQKKQYETGEGHAIFGFINKLSFDKETYSYIKRDIYEHGHGEKGQVQDHILIKLGD